jgi:hypothetical protein
MGWWRIAGLWAVLAALAAHYWLVEQRHPEPSADRRPERRRFLGIRVEELREVRLLRAGRTIVSRRAGGGWAVVDPPDTSIPSDLIAAFTDALARAEEIDRVGDAGTDPRAYGLDEEAARVEMIGAGGEPVVVTIGATNPTGTAVYARRHGAPEIVLIGRDVRYYGDLLFQALAPSRVPSVERAGPVGG